MYRLIHLCTWSGVKINVIIMNVSQNLIYTQSINVKISSLLSLHRHVASSAKALLRGLLITSIYSRDYNLMQRGLKARYWNRGHVHLSVKHGHVKSGCASLSGRYRSSSLITYFHHRLILNTVSRKDAARARESVSRMWDRFSLMAWKLDVGRKQRSWIKLSFSLGTKKEMDIL